MLADRSDDIVCGPPAKLLQSEAVKRRIKSAVSDSGTEASNTADHTRNSTSTAPDATPAIPAAGTMTTATAEGEPTRC